jgi:hypothetical protein
MARAIADPPSAGRPSWASPEIATGLLMAGVLAAGLGLVAGLMGGLQVVGPRPDAPSAVSFARGLDAARSLAVGCPVFLIVGLVLVAAVRLDRLRVAARDDLSRRRAALVGAFAAVPAVLAGLLVGVGAVVVQHTFSAPYAGNPIPPDRFAEFDAGFALVAFLLVFTSVTLVGSAFRRSRNRA